MPIYFQESKVYQDPVISYTVHLIFKIIRINTAIRNEKNFH